MTQNMNAIKCETSSRDEVPQLKYFNVCIKEEQGADHSEEQNATNQDMIHYDYDCDIKIEDTDVKAECFSNEDEDSSLGEIRKVFEDMDWNERFIETIQSKPPIYNADLPEYSDRNLISRLWDEICRTVVPKWQNMTSNEKSAKERELQNRWKNLCSCFRRELNKQKIGASGQSAKKRRKYLYFDKLLFLLPIMKNRSTANERSQSPILEHNSETEEDFQDIQRVHELQNENTSQAYTQQIRTKPVRSFSQAKDKKALSYEESLIEEKMEEYIDEDKSFLLSLIPTFKKLNDMQNLEAKIEFLATLKRLSNPS